jgi:hypothetical protein
MATPKCIAVNCDVQDIFDKTLKPAVLKQIKQTVQTLVDKNKSKGLSFDPNCKNGWLLKVTVVSLELDDPRNPKTMKTNVSVHGSRLDGVTSGMIKASGNAKATHIRPKKLEEEAKLIVHDALGEVMTRDVLPAILKP